MSIHVNINDDSSIHIPLFDMSHVNYSLFAKEDTRYIKNNCVHTVTYEIERNYEQTMKILCIKRLCVLSYGPS